MATKRDKLTLWEKVKNIKKPSICFIDDEQEELDRFIQCFDKDFTIGIGTSPQRARDNLKEQTLLRRSPHFYLLDLYYREEPNTKEQMHRLHIAHQNLLEAQSDFRALLAKLGQDRKGGLDLAADVKKYHKIRRARFAFFTRKGFGVDVIAAYDAGAETVIKKPDPTSEQVAKGDLEVAYDEALAGTAPLILNKIERAIAESGLWKKHREFFYGMLTSAIPGVGIYLFDHHKDVGEFIQSLLKFFGFHQ